MTADLGTRRRCRIPLPPSPRRSALRSSERIGSKVAGPLAAEVDRDARFPAEAIQALREERMLSVLVPVELGGAGATITQVAAAVEALGRHCASTAMVYAMHQIQVASIVRHGRSEWMHDYLAQIAEHELLLASATTETGIGGDVRSSSCAVERDGDRFRLEKDAPVISYGAQPTRCSSPRAARPTARRTIRFSWSCRHAGDARGAIRAGTRSDFGAPAATDSCCAPKATSTRSSTDAYGEISSQHDAAHLAHRVGGGVARASPATPSTSRARYVRAEARRKPGTTPPAAVRLAELDRSLRRVPVTRAGARVGVRARARRRRRRSRAWASRFA